MNSLIDQSEELDRMIEEKHIIIENLDNEIEEAKNQKILNAEE